MQNPITFSTPARLYQDRSNSTISPAAGSWLDVALEVPLRALALGRRRQGDDAGDAWVQVLRNPLDRAALAGGVTPFEDHDEAHPVRPYPLLDLDQLLLQPEQLPFVLPLWEAGAG